MIVKGSEFMMRKMMSADVLHPSIREDVLTFQSDVVAEVMQAVQDNRIVVVGMRWNNSVRKARRNLEKAGLDFSYLEYGSYTSEWHKRLGLKMWTGFPTFPMVFVDQQLVGGNSDLESLLATSSL